MSGTEKVLFVLFRAPGSREALVLLNICVIIIDMPKVPPAFKPYIVRL